MSTIIDKLEKAQIKRHPHFDPGDRVRVHFQVIEGTRSRTQVFEGIVIKRQGSGARETFTVRKQSFGVGVERTFPVHSTKIEKIEVAARGEVRRAKLYYLRDRVGKRARVRERAWTPAEQARLDAEAAGAYDKQGSQEEAELVAPEVVDEEAVAEEAVTGEAVESAAEESSSSAGGSPAGEDSSATTDGVDGDGATADASEGEEEAPAPAAEESAQDSPAAEEVAEDGATDDDAAEEAPAADADAG